MFISQFCRFRECRLSLHCHYSMIHTNLQWLYLLGFNLWIKFIGLTIFARYRTTYKQKKTARNIYIKNITIKVWWPRFSDNLSWNNPVRFDMSLKSLLILYFQVIRILQGIFVAVDIVSILLLISSSSVSFSKPLGTILGTSIKFGITL